MEFKSKISHCAPILPLNTTFLKFVYNFFVCGYFDGPLKTAIFKSLLGMLKREEKGSQYFLLGTYSSYGGKVSGTILQQTCPRRFLNLLVFDLHKNQFHVKKLLVYYYRQYYHNLKCVYCFNSLVHPLMNSFWNINIKHIFERTIFCPNFKIIFDMPILMYYSFHPAFSLLNILRFL